MKKTLLVSFLLLILFINACAKTQQQSQITQQTIQKTVPTVSAEDVSTLSPEQVVILYFQAWNDQQYDVMYSLISDGFKQIDSEAKTFESFKSYMEKFFDTSNGVRVVSAEEKYRNEKEAGIEYKIEIENKDGNKKEFSSTYTLKKRTSNASERERTRSQVTGWKLIHPYGQNIDTT